MDSHEFRAEFRDFVTAIFRDEFKEVGEELRDEFLAINEGNSLKIDNLENEFNLLIKRLDADESKIDGIIFRIEQLEGDTSIKIDTFREELLSRIEIFDDKILSLKDELILKIDEELEKAGSEKEIVLLKVDNLRDDFQDSINSAVEDFRSKIELMNKKFIEVSEGFGDISRSFEYNMKKMGELEDEFKSIKARQDIINDLIRRINSIEDSLKKRADKF